MKMFGCVWFAFLAAGTVAHCQTYEANMPPQPGEQFQSAAFRLWLPEDLKTVRAIIVRQHGCGRNGIDHADDLQWRTLAKKHGAALLSSRLTYSGSCAEWCVPMNGTERAFLDALKSFAK
jgi:poly(3-hydroxybutyrate) depolymerase